jgi:hypothetical protein
VRLDTLDMRGVLEKLGDVHTSPAATEEDVTRLAETWLEVLGDLPLTSINRAVTVYLKSEKRFFPKPGEIRALARQYLEPGVETLADRHAAWLRNGMSDRLGGRHTPCPVCGAELAFYRRFEMRHDQQRHYEAGVGYAGEPTDRHRVNGCLVNPTQLTMETVR